MHIMNLYCIVVFVINMTNIMSITVIILLHRIPLMDTHLMLMILIKISNSESHCKISVKPRLRLDHQKI